MELCHKIRPEGVEKEWVSFPESPHLRRVPCVPDPRSYQKARLSREDTAPESNCFSRIMTLQGK